MQEFSKLTPWVAGKVLLVEQIEVGGTVKQHPGDLASALDDDGPLTSMWSLAILGHWRWVAAPRYALVADNATARVKTTGRTAGCRKTSPSPSRLTAVLMDTVSNDQP